MSRELLQAAGIGPEEQFDFPPEELVCGQEVISFLYTYGHLPSGDAMKHDVLSSANRVLKRTDEHAAVDEKILNEVLRVIHQAGLATTN
jgi:hypothetical protein